MEKTAEFPNENEYEVVMNNYTPPKTIKCSRRQIVYDPQFVICITNFDGTFKSNEFTIRTIKNE